MSPGNAGLHVEAGQQAPLRVIHQYSQQHVAGPGIHLDAGEEDVPLHAERLAIAAEDLHLQFRGHGSCLLAQGFQHRGRLADIDIDLIDLLDPGHGGGIGGRHQGTFAHQGLIDAPGDGGLYAGKLQVQLVPGQGCPGLGHVGGRLIPQGEGVVIGLATDGLGAQQRHQAVNLDAGARQHGLGPLQCRGGAVDVCLEGGRVYLEQHCTRADLGALLEQAALHYAADLGANFGAAQCRHPGGQILADDKIFSCQRHHRHLKGGRRILRLRRPITTRQPEYGNDCKQGARIPLFDKHHTHLVKPSPRNGVAARAHRAGIMERGYCE
ncbi:hypothetical protein D3C80_624150 [compost metagenome]